MIEINIDLRVFCRAKNSRTFRITVNVSHATLYYLGRERLYPVTERPAATVGKVTQLTSRDSIRATAYRVRVVPFPVCTPSVEAGLLALRTRTDICTRFSRKSRIFLRLLHPPAVFPVFAVYLGRVLLSYHRVQFENRR